MDPCRGLVSVSLIQRCRDQPVVIFFRRLVSMPRVSRCSKPRLESTDLRPFSSRPFAIVDAIEVVSLNKNETIMQHRI